MVYILIGFINSTKLFDHIFTVDENCIPKYKAIVDEKVTVNSLIFAVQSKFPEFLQALTSNQQKLTL